ncbi:hypothetical protein CIW72_06245 [Xanthomonas citri pv. malvacearum]|nr:hypothetical protein CIW72_06245 [Xanthomonas citri pv. malvacearum]
MDLGSPNVGKPRKSLQGRTCGVSRDGGRARALQPSTRSIAPWLIHPKKSSTSCSALRCPPPRNGRRARGPIAAAPQIT